MTISNPLPLLVAGKYCETTNGRIRIGMLTQQKQNDDVMMKGTTARTSLNMLKPRLNANERIGNPQTKRFLKLERIWFDIIFNVRRCANSIRFGDFQQWANYDSLNIFINFDEWIRPPRTMPHTAHDSVYFLCVHSRSFVFIVGALNSNKIHIKYAPRARKREENKKEKNETETHNFCHIVCDVCDCGV